MSLTSWSLAPSSGIASSAPQLADAESTSSCSRACSSGVRPDTRGRDPIKGRSHVAFAALTPGIVLRCRSRPADRRVATRTHPPVTASASRIADTHPETAHQQPVIRTSFKSDGIELTTSARHVIGSLLATSGVCAVLFLEARLTTRRDATRLVFMPKSASAHAPIMRRPVNLRSASKCENDVNASW